MKKARRGGEREGAREEEERREGEEKEEEEEDINRQTAFSCSADRSLQTFQLLLNVCTKAVPSGYVRTAVSTDTSPCPHCGVAAEETCSSPSHRRMDSDERVHNWAGLGTGEFKRS